MLESV